MSEDARPPAPEGTGRRASRWRWPRRGALLLAAAVAAFVTLFLSIDLGPHVRGYLERTATSYFERPTHIRSVSLDLVNGRLVAEGVVVEGVEPTHVPFLRADRVFISIPMRGLLRRRAVIDVELDRWAVAIESWANRGSAPRVRPRGGGGGAVSVQLNLVFARDGRFTYTDHVLPWNITCENVAINIVNSRGEFAATVGFRGGVVNILQYEPIRLDTMSARLTIDGGTFRVHQMTVVADGSRSHMRGWVDAERWPEFRFDVETGFDIARAKDIFFHRDRFTATGRGTFRGTVHKFQRGGFDVNGEVASPVLDVSGLEFPNFGGHVVWVPNRLEVAGAESAFAGGTARLAFVLETLAQRGTVADLSATYRNVDLLQFGRLWNWQGIALASRATGWHAMRWPSGRFDQMQGDGVLRATPMDGRPLASATLPTPAVQLPKEDPFVPDRPLPDQAVGGEIVYRMTPAGVEFGPSWAATPETHLSFTGRTGWRDDVQTPFRVVSTDWQASDRLLAGVLAAFGTKIGVIDIGGRGVFDGVLTNWFSRPRIVGHLEGDGLRAWDVVWGRARADLAIENNYATVTNSLIGDNQTPSAPWMVADGRYSLGYPRADGGEEFDARIRIERWPITDFRHAFELDDWPVEGTGFADLRLYGAYQGPQGFGILRVTPGSAWEEPFTTFTGRLTFEGFAGMRVDAIELTKSTGVMRGAAYLGWPAPQNNGFGTYSFTFDGERIPIESLESFTIPDADLTGLLSFRMFGSGSNERPRYEWEGQAIDLFWGDEGIGQATAHLVVEKDVLTVDRLDVASDRLSLSGFGRVSLNDTYDAEATLRVTETSIDPFLRFAAPGLSPYTRAIASGSVRVRGPLMDVSKLGVDVTVDRADLRLLDFELTNPIGPDGVAKPLRMAFAQNQFRIDDFELTGEGTSLSVTGSVHRLTEAINVTLRGNSSLAILQGVNADVRASGQTTISANVGGTIDAPSYSGSATITGGRLRHYSFPHSLDQLNGVVTFDASGLRLDGLRARMGTGGGQILFGGTIGLREFVPGELAVTMRGAGLDLRFPEGFRSVVDVDLAVDGSVSSAVMSGRVTVRQARYVRRLQGNAGLLGLAAGGDDVPIVPAIDTGPAVDVPLTFAVDLVGQRLTMIDDADANVVVSPDLRFTGSLDRPSLSGRVEIDRAETEFLGNRYTVDGYVEFNNPNEIEPYFDLEARTQIRQPLQEYRIDIRFTGTLASFTYDLSSDPPLSQVDQLSLILGQNPDLQRTELRAIESPQEVQSQLMSSVLAQLVASPLTTQVGRVVERTFNVDTFTVTPLLGTEATLTQVPGARITVGKRVSQRVYLTYSRSLETATSLDYDLLLLEYTQNERMSWVLSRNQDGTFALDFRVRYRF